MSNSLKEKKLKSGQISVKPFVYNIPSISSVSIRFIILLSLQIIMLAVTKSYIALIVILATLLGSLAASVVNYFVSKEPLFNIMNIAIQGLFIGLLLPESFPPFTAFVISFSTIVVARCIVFKGINSWLNTATIAVIIAKIRLSSAHTGCALVGPARGGSGSTISTISGAPLIVSSPATKLTT